LIHAHQRVVEVEHDLAIHQCAGLEWIECDDVRVEADVECAAGDGVVGRTRTARPAATSKRDQQHAKESQANWERATDCAAAPREPGGEPRRWERVRHVENLQCLADTLVLDNSVLDEPTRVRCAASETPSCAPRHPRMPRLSVSCRLLADAV